MYTMMRNMAYVESVFGEIIIYGEMLESQNRIIGKEVAYIRLRPIYNSTYHT